MRHVVLKLVPLSGSSRRDKPIAGVLEGFGGGELAIVPHVDLGEYVASLSAAARRLAVGAQNARCRPGAGGINGWRLRRGEAARP